MPNQNNQDITKIYEMIQKENRLNRITDSVKMIVFLIPTFILLWKTFKGRKLTHKQRLMRIDEAIARLQLKRQTTVREAFHEAELKKMETGLDLAESKIDLLSGLKQKGQSLLKDQLNQVNKVVDDQIKSATDKLKVDKFLDKDKKEK